MNRIIKFCQKTIFFNFGATVSGAVICIFIPIWPLLIWPFVNSLMLLVGFASQVKFENE